MAPIVDGSNTLTHARGAGILSAIRADPVRFAVRAILTLYLAPVILLVFVIGGTSILASEAARLPARVSQRLARRSQVGRKPWVKVSEATLKPRLVFRRGRMRTPR